MEEETAQKGDAGVQEPTKSVPAVDHPTWDEFEARLTGVLERMAVDTYLVVGTRPNADDGSSYYVQFAQGGRAGFLAEAVSNRYLAGTGAISPMQEQRLGELGWQWPNPRSKTELNFSREWPMPTPFDEAATLAVRTLREIYGVERTDDLAYKSFSRDGHRFAQPSLAIDAEVPSESQERHPAIATMQELKPLVEGAIKKFLNVGEVKYDERGDIPIRLGSAMVFVRLADGSPPIVGIFSPVVWGIPGSAGLLEAVNDINTRIRFGRVAWTGREVMATMEVSAAGITVDDIAFTCLQVGGIADHFDEELQQRFGGITMFGSPQPPKEPGGAGYL
ncbi:MAG: YbjN domain-containing protein [Actinomycetota bacterium]|nr:YbjN domain-containing protein [Actinomycetota bacterium]